MKFDRPRRLDVEAIVQQRADDALGPGRHFFGPNKNRLRVELQFVRPKDGHRISPAGGPLRRGGSRSLKLAQIISGPEPENFSSLRER